MTVSNKGRRPFKRIEVEWCARQMDENPGQILAVMDRLYRNAQANVVRNGDPARKTWCVKRYGDGASGVLVLVLEGEAADMVARLGNPMFGRPAGSRFERRYFREA